MLFLLDTLVNNEICGQGNGSIYVSASGGQPTYTYNIGTISNNTGVFVALNTSTYTVQTTDLNGCTSSILVNVPLTVGPTPVIDYQQNVLCPDGINGDVIIAITSTTGMPSFTYNFDNTGATASNTATLNAGAHSVELIDANSCINTLNFSLIQPPSFIIYVYKNQCNM